MVARVLVIGGYGNFGSHIARVVAGDSEIRLLVGGRSIAKAQGLITSIRPVHPAEAHAIDINGDLPEALARIAPDVVIHTSGPFQRQDHRVARACIAQGCHYLDLADARDFVAAIGSLDAEAKARDVLVVSGASSVPCLTAAVIDAYLPCFARLDAVDYGITTAQQTNRGLATNIGGAKLCRRTDDNAPQRAHEDRVWLGGHPCRALPRAGLATFRQLRYP